MTIQLRQSAGNTVRAGTFRSCPVSLSQSTQPNSLVVVIASTTHPRENSLALAYTPSGFIRALTRKEDKLTVAVWTRTSSTPISSLSIQTFGETYGIQVRVLEYTGVAQTAALDKLIVKGDNPEGRPGSLTPNTGSTGTLAQADELIVGITVNRYGSTTQSGFTGGLAHLSETLSSGTEPDHDRTRLTVRTAIATTTNAWSQSSRLSANRDWVAAILTFKGGSLGPARMTSLDQAPIVVTTGTGSLSAFGPLRSLTPEVVVPVLSGVGVQARVGPFDYQYKLGGWDGLVIGNDTPYQIEALDGLEGWQVRTSDVEFPRGDGALRGVDLQSSRTILFELKVGGTTAFVENAMDTLYRALVPQRDRDWELIWRHPGRPLRMVRCRPIDLVRGLTWQEVVVNHQKLALLAADPRHYSAFMRQATIPNTAAGVDPVPTTVLNQGSGMAHPSIRITGPTSGPPVTRVELINNTFDLSFAVEAVLPTGTALLGDMEARATGAARSVVTVDGQSKYGAWLHPRETFRLGPGANDVHLVTVPAGAPVSCTLDYRDTWSG